MRGLLKYWADGFDWRLQERRLNEFAHFRGEIDGVRIHFVHELRGGIPLILTHGWPSTFVEHLQLAPLLPEFDLVIPSLPGYGFSERPPRTTIRDTARLWHRLMQGLGYKRYGAQGGAFAAARLRADHNRLLMGQQIARRKPQVSQTSGTMHVVTSQELRCGTLDRRRRCPLPMRSRPRHHRLALGERVLSLGQPARSGQLDAHPSGIGDLGSRRGSEHEGGELAGAEAVLGRPGTHDVAPWRGVDPVALARAVSWAIASRPPSPTSTPAATSSRSRSSIWRRRVENSRNTSGGSC